MSKKQNVSLQLTPADMAVLVAIVTVEKLPKTECIRRALREYAIKLGMVMALALTSGCAVGVSDAPTETATTTPAFVYPVYSACTTVTDSVPNDACGKGQLSVTRCTNATDSPDTDHCTGPAKNPAQSLGVVWCCK